NHSHHKHSILTHAIRRTNLLTFFPCNHYHDLQITNIVNILNAKRILIVYDEDAAGICFSKLIQNNFTGKIEVSVQRFTNVLPKFNFAPFQLIIIWMFNISKIIQANDVMKIKNKLLLVRIDETIIQKKAFNNITLFELTFQDNTKNMNLFIKTNLGLDCDLQQ
uniref:Uncharacterized protein n=1 Tax=Strigamia maritima TaxID=126957 RepID=T1J9U5_STRMM